MPSTASSRVWGDEDLWTTPQRAARSRGSAEGVSSERTLAVASATRAARAAAAAAAHERPTALPATRAAGAAGAGVPGRRTVTIRGQVAPPRRAPARRRPARSPVERLGTRPDRIALWAVMMGFFLILVAATSGHML